MKTKQIFLAIALFIMCLANAQITPSITIPNPLPNYDGSYDNFGQGHLYYPNDGEVLSTNPENSDMELISLSGHLS